MHPRHIRRGAPDVPALMRDRVLRLVFVVVIAAGFVACTQGPGSGSQAPAAPSSPVAASPAASGADGDEYGPGGY